MLAEQNETIKGAVVTLRKLSEDEKIQLQCEAREKYEHDFAAMKHFGEQIGLQKGEQKERDNSCRNLVSSLRDFNISDEDIIKKLMEKYQLSEEDAKTFL